MARKAERYHGQSQSSTQSRAEVAQVQVQIQTDPPACHKVTRDIFIPSAVTQHHSRALSSALLKTQPIHHSHTYTHRPHLLDIVFL